MKIGIITIQKCDNFGATVVDALAHGKPVITSTNTPWKIVSDRQCGWWVGNVAVTLAKSIEEAMSLTDAERKEMGRRGRELVEEKFT